MRWPLSRPLTTTCWAQLVCYPYDKPYVVGAMNSPSFTDTEAEQQRRWREGLQPRAPAIILLYLPLSGWILGPDPLQSHFRAPEGCETPGDGGLGGSLQDISQSVSQSVQSLSRVRFFATPWTEAHQASLSIANFQSLLKLMSIESVMPSTHLILCCLLLLPPSVFPSIRVFSKESVLCIRWPKYWSFSFSISPFNDPGLISPRMDWLNLLAVQGTLQESSPTPQFKSIHSLALSFLYSPTLTSIHDYQENHSLTRRTFVGKVISLLFKMLSRLVIAFLPRSKRLLILWLQSPSAVIL